MNPLRRGVSALVWSVEDLSPPKEHVLYNFQNEIDRKSWSPYSDKLYGGTTEVTLEESKCGQHLVFHGDLSSELSQNAPAFLKRSGFAGIKSQMRRKSAELEPFTKLAFRVKGDGKVYISTLKTENWIGGLSGPEESTWQAFIFAPRNEWAIVEIPLTRYLLTWKGKVVDSETDVNLRELVGMGISLPGRAPVEEINNEGQFRLRIDWVKCLRN